MAKADAGKDRRALFGLLRIDLVFVFAVFAMVVEPTSDDVRVVAVVAALLVAGAALVLHGMGAALRQQPRGAEPGSTEIRARGAFGWAART